MPLSKAEYEKIVGPLSDDQYNKLVAPNAVDTKQSRDASAYEGAGFKPKRGESNQPLDSGMTVAKQETHVSPLGSQGTVGRGGAYSTVSVAPATMSNADTRENAAKKAWFAANPLPPAPAAPAPTADGGMSAMKTVNALTPYDAGAAIGQQPRQTHTMGATAGGAPAPQPTAVAGATVHPDPDSYDAVIANARKKWGL
jgi:hypothetical protein